MSKNYTRVYNLAPRRQVTGGEKEKIAIQDPNPVIRRIFGPRGNRICNPMLRNVVGCIAWTEKGERKREREREDVSEKWQDGGRVYRVFLAICRRIDHRWTLLRSSVRIKFVYLRQKCIERLTPDVEGGWGADANDNNW